MNEALNVPEGHGAVYLITNLINDKVYVGQTWAGVRNRWKKHLSDANSKRRTHFCSAIRKHGEESFSLELLGVASTQPDLDNLESLWIILLGSLDSAVGYNTRGGGSNGKSTESTRKKISAVLNIPEIKEKQRSGCLRHWEENPDRHENNSQFAKKQWEDPQFRETQTARLKELWSDPVLRERQAEITKQQMSLPGSRENLSAKAKERWEDESFRKQQTEAISSPESRAKMSAASLSAWEVPQYRETITAALKRRSPETKSGVSKKMKEAWAVPENREKWLTAQKKGRERKKEETLC